MERCFTNELGNQIRISCSDFGTSVREIRYMVEIEVEGPNSSSSWLLTYQEAEVLQDLLQVHLTRKLGDVQTAQ
jgi:hypothetical protein